MSDIDFPALIEPVARHFWGEPNKGLTTKIGMRFGSNGSRSIVFKTGEWYDHEQHVGGGVLALVIREVESVTTEPEAVRWLEDQGFVAKDGATASHSRQVTEDRPERPTGQPEPQAPPEHAEAKFEWIPVKGYRYTDGDGNVLYEVIRYHARAPDGTWVLGKSGNPKKTFKQRRPDGKGGYVWSLGDVEHTLFRRQEIERAIEAGKTIFLPEGEKDVETIEAWGLVGTTNSGGAQNWRPEMARFLRGADVVILGDDDEPGRARVGNVARSLRGIAARVRAIYDWDGQKDVTDWKDVGHTASELGEILNTLPDYRPRPPQSKFGAVDLKAIGTGLGRKHTWLVQDMIELGGSCALAGFSQSGKSFLTIKLTFAIVMGEQFFGRDVMQGMVVYQLGEGEAGFEKRIEGFMKDRGLDDISGLPLVILPKKINLFASDDDTDALIKEIKDWSEYHQQPCRMVVIDTYNKATRGMNEISGQDNGKVIDRVERISRETGATVMVIDHLSMGGRIRGHGSKTDDMTNTIRVEKDEKKVDNNGRPIRNMILAKNKDGEAGQKIPFVLRQVVNGFDDKGRPITTCVVDPPDGNQEELEKSGRLPLNQATILRVLRDTIDIDGVQPPDGLRGVPAGKRVVQWKTFKAMLERKWQYTAPENEPEQRAKELHRIVTDACKKLQLAGYIDKDNPSGMIWWTGKTDRPLPKPRPADPSPLPDAVRSEIGMTEAPF